MAENNNGYTQSQILTMQQDAMRRVNEMQRISRERLGNNVSVPAHQPQPDHHNPPAKSHHVEKKEEQEIERCQPEVVQNGFKGILERLNLDEEKIIIIMLLILLVNEGADIMLILALVYILL
ncbi:MAG: hypothetical protein RR444_00750 [Oscillospiraceae bacterium]